MSDRNGLIAGKIQEIGAMSFPDDDVRWKIIDIIHEGAYSAVEAYPDPATVGYAKFRFILHFPEEGRCEVAGCYCLEDRRWVLLFSNPEISPEWKGFLGSN